KTDLESVTLDFRAAPRAANAYFFQISPEVVTGYGTEGEQKFRLAQSVLLTDETGATDYHQTETLSDRVQVKKVFQLDSADLESAELFLFGTAKTVTVNGKAVAEVKRLESTGRSRAKIPVEWLRA